MKVVITGASRGMGKAAVILFLKNGHNVFGIDVNESPFKDNSELELECGENHGKYTHFIADISKKETLPQIEEVEILINNAGVQPPIVNAEDSLRDINTNLVGTIYVTQKYAFQPKIKSVLFNASVSGITGNEFPVYAASKAGVIGYMKNTAIRLANDFKATCNALCFGGVETELNKSVMEDKALWQKIMDVTPLKKWLKPQEAAQWIYFLTVTNTFCTGQAIDVSGGERNCADLFVW